MEKHIYFVRHGESEGNVSGIFHGGEVLLTKNGHEQAALAAERVAHLNVGALITSPFLRASLTADAISKTIGLQAEPNNLFVEWVPPSSFIGQHREDPELKKAYEVIFDSSDKNYRHSDEETFNEFSARAEMAAKFLEAHESERICVVTHSGVIRMMVGLLTLRGAFSKEHFTALIHNFYLHNTGITYIKYNSEQGGWKLITWNDQAHLG